MLPWSACCIRARPETQHRASSRVKAFTNPGLFPASLRYCGGHTTVRDYREIGSLLPNNQRQHRTLQIQKDVLPYALG